MQSDARLGPFPVRTAAGDVDAFAAALGLTAATGMTAVPLTFPMRWLALPEVRAAIGAALGDVGGLPLHESQTFEYRRPLDRDRDYRLDVTIVRDAASPQRATLRGTVRDAGGAEVVMLDTVLRVVELPAERKP